jgi:hypothetical protein
MVLRLALYAYLKKSGSLILKTARLASDHSILYGMYSMTLKKITLCLCSLALFFAFQSELLAASPVKPLCQKCGQVHATGIPDQNSHPLSGA